MYFFLSNLYDKDHSPKIMIKNNVQTADFKKKNIYPLIKKV